MPFGRSRSQSRSKRRSSSAVDRTRHGSAVGRSCMQQSPLGSFPSFATTTSTNISIKNKKNRFKKKDGHDTSYTLSDSSREEPESMRQIKVSAAPLVSIDTTMLSPPDESQPRKTKNGQIMRDDVSSLNVGESVSGMAEPKARTTTAATNRRGRHKQQHPSKEGRRSSAGQTTRKQSGQIRSLSSSSFRYYNKGVREAARYRTNECNVGVDDCQPVNEEVDLLLDTIALAGINNAGNSKSKGINKEKNRKGRYCLTTSKTSSTATKRGSIRKEEDRLQQERHRRHLFEDGGGGGGDGDGDYDNGRRSCHFRAHDSDAASEVLIGMVSNLQLDLAGALTSSAVGLSLLSASPPDDGWTHPPCEMVRESLDRHIRVCLDASSPSSLSESGHHNNNNNNNTKDTTDPQSVSEIALLHISEGENIKALENLRVLLQNQRKERGTTGFGQASEELDIASTKSKLAILSLMTKNHKDALKYTVSSLLSHRKAGRPVHTTLATMELGLVYVGIEQLSQALQCWREALQLACQTLGYDHLQVAVLLTNLGCLHYYLGNRSASLSALEESLGLQRQILRSNSECASVEVPLFQMSNTMANLALVLARCCNSYESAISLMEEALAIQESVLTRSDGVKIVSEKYLEMFTKLRDEAEDTAAEGKTSAGNDNSSSNNSILFASNHSSLMQQQQHMSIFGDSDGIPRRHDGSKHHQMSCSGSVGEDSYDCILLGSLVNPLTARQRIRSTVVQSIETAARMQPNVSGDEASVTSRVLATRKKQSIPVDLDGEAIVGAEFHLEEINLQALDHLNRNEFKDALDLFEGALRSHKDKYGDIHHLVGTGLHNCGIVHMAGEQYIQAKLCFQEAVSVRIAALGETHPDVNASRFKIGMIEQAAGDHECAISTYMDCIFHVQQNMSTYGFAPEAKMLNNIGVVLYEMGRHVDAFQSFFKAYQIQKGLTKDPNCAAVERSLASTLSNLAFIYANQAQFSDALGAYEEALGILQKHYPIDHPYVVTVEENLAHVRAYGAVRTGPQTHAQSEVFASCSHVGSKRDQHVQSKIGACFMPFPR